MKYINKIVAVLAAIIGVMAAVTGSRVLLGLFDPGYNYFTALISYNVFMGVVSFVAGILIWRQNSKALPLSKIISSFHIIVLLLLITVFREIISIHSISAMTFRSVAWVIFTLFLWKVFPKSE